MGHRETLAACACCHVGRQRMQLLILRWLRETAPGRDAEKLSTSLLLWRPRTREPHIDALVEVFTNAPCRLAGILRGMECMWWPFPFLTRHVSVAVNLI